MSKHWIAGALNPAHKGDLRKKLGAKKGQKISTAKLDAAAKKPGLLGHQARVARVLRHINSMK
jgi:hypothetical protein